MSTAGENEGRCSNCGSTREACDARADSWPRFCCPACLRNSPWGTHRAGAPAEPQRKPQLVTPMMARA
jgi:hypothetical protein